jgi:hypothetical protein
MADPNKIAEAEAEGAKISWGSIAAEKIRDIGNDMRTDIAEGTKEGFKNGMNDIRHKLVEEAWFGKEVTGDAEYLKESETDQTTSQNQAKEEITSESLYGKGQDDVASDDLYGKNINNGDEGREPPEQDL